MHSDVLCLVRQASISGANYIVTFINAFSRYIWVFFVKEISEALFKFKEFKKKVESKLNKKV